MSQCLPFLPDGSLDGGCGDLPELLEFGNFVEPYWDSDAEQDLNTLLSPQPPILSPPPPAPSPPPPVLLSSPVRGPRLVPAHPPTPPPVTLGDPITPRTQYYLSRHTLAEYPSWEQLVMFNLRRYSFAVERRGPLLLWEQGTCVSRSSFVTRSEERALRLMRREYYLHHPDPPPQTPRTTAHSIEPVVKSPSQPSLAQLAAHRRTSLLPLRNVHPQRMNGNPPVAQPPCARPRALRPTKGYPTLMDIARRREDNRNPAEGPARARRRITYFNVGILQGRGRQG